MFFMRIISTNFQNNALIPARFTADGENICPDFYIYDVPDGTASLAIVCHDPDATAGVPWVHWIAWDIPATTVKVTSGTLPIGSVLGTTSFATKSYGGPSPSPGSGPHRYVFTLYALRHNANLGNMQLTYSEIIGKIEPLTITKAQWMGIYERI